MTAGELEHKYEIEVKKTDVRQKIPAETKDDLRSSGMMDEKGKLKLNGVSPKMLKKMKQEYVECPIYKEDTHFIKCFICPNFQSRVTGKVLCRGSPL